MAYLLVEFLLRQDGVEPMDSLGGLAGCEMFGREGMAGGLDRAAAPGLEESLLEPVTLGHASVIRSCRLSTGLGAEARVTSAAVTSSSVVS